MGMALIFLAVVVLLATGAAAWAVARHQAALAPVSEEVVELAPGTRTRLEALRREAKFRPQDFPPPGYPGPDWPEDAPILEAAANDFIEAVLAKPDGPLAARDVSEMMRRPIGRTRWLATGDRDRTADYLIEVWYILGFRGSTGRFAHGAGYLVPPGYAEPLPPGWTAPDRPRLH